MKRNDAVGLCLAAVFALLAGCDAVDKKIQSEREDRNYRSAMADYQAGRLDAAVAGFEKATAANPANSSARFQLACLLQDVKKDYLGALCAFREYLLQQPQSDKAALARTRLQTCERELASVLAAKYHLDGSENLKTIEELRRELKENGDRLAAAEKDVQSTRTRLVALSEERDRLVAVVKGTGESDEKETAPAGALTAKQAKDLLEEEESSEVDRVEMSRDIAELRADEREESEGASSILPVQPADAKAKRDQAAADRERLAQDEQETERQRHPAEYVVQEGDTLYRLAERFYGRISAWKAIRDANKAVISNDGRLRTGTRITLPYGVK